MQNKILINIYVFFNLEPVLEGNPYQDLYVYNITYHCLVKPLSYDSNPAIIHILPE